MTLLHNKVFLHLVLAGMPTLHCEDRLFPSQPFPDLAIGERYRDLHFHNERIHSLFCLQSRRSPSHALAPHEQISYTIISLHLARAPAVAITRPLKAKRDL